MQARLRAEPADFRVCEDLQVEFSDDGEHDLLWIEKTGANTAWVARKLAAYAGVKTRDVGYSGLKDRHAIARQWFSVRRPNRDGTDWRRFTAEGIQLLDIRRHYRKLKRGTHRANTFRIALRSVTVTSLPTEIENRVSRIAKVGVPNYFGEQRFGRGGSNIGLAREVLNGRRVAREKRSIALSAARSLLFNSILNVRVEQSNWHTVIGGDLANLDGSRSVFAIDSMNAELARRCAEFDIHPTGTLWGEGAPLTTNDAAAIECSAVESYADLATGLLNARIAAGSRALRLVPGNLSCEIDAGVLWLEFTLPAGGFATAVIREIATLLP